MNLLSCLPIFMVFICHAEKTIYGERIDMDPGMNQREVNDSELGNSVRQGKTINFGGKKLEFYGVF